MKLKQEHGGTLNDIHDLRLRSSMRSRMSKTYIDELRGGHQPERSSPTDMNNNTNNTESNRSSHCSVPPGIPLPLKLTPTSPPLTNPPTKRWCSTCHSTLSLRDVQVHATGENSHSTTEQNRPECRSLSKTMVLNPLSLENLTVEEIERIAYEKEDSVSDDARRKTSIRVKPAMKNNSQHHLAVPAAGDFCIRIPNVSATCDDPHQQHIDLHETRLSDALGYLRMYKNHNRIQFDALQSNDRQDLQVTSFLLSPRELGEQHPWIRF